MSFMTVRQLSSRLLVDAEATGTVALMNAHLFVSKKPVVACVGGFLGSATGISALV